ncbi:MAG: LptF/LptG family permease [Desulfopila sp.]
MNVISRMPLLLYSYLATEMLAPFFASFLVMNGVFFLVKLIPFLNFALDLHIGLADFIRLFAYLLPNMLLYTVPMAAMMGIIICFSRLANDTEILAMKASGISIYHILPPLFVIASVIALTAGYVSVTLIPKADTAMKQLTYQLLKEKIDHGIKEDQFTEALGDLVVYVREIDRETGDWKDVWVSDMRGQKTPVITMANSGRMTSDIAKMDVTILLMRGSLHRSEGQTAQIVNFEKYLINIPLQLPQRIKINERNTYDMGGLLTAADSYGLDTEKGRDMLVEFNKRLVLPAGCLIMSLLGLPLGLLAGPGRKTVGIPIGLGAFILYYVLFTTFKNMAEEGVGPVFVLMWIPNLLFLAGAMYGIHRLAQEKHALPEPVRLLASRGHRSLLIPLCGRLRHLSRVVQRVVQRARPPADLTETLPEYDQPVTANPNTNLFHLADCGEHDEPTNTVYFDSVSEALEAGFQPCDHCRQRLQTRDSPR